MIGWSGKELNGYENDKKKVLRRNIKICDTNNKDETGKNISIGTM